MNTVGVIKFNVPYIFVHQSHKFNDINKFYGTFESFTNDYKNTADLFKQIVQKKKFVRMNAAVLSIS
jgi:hypothetical protein